MGFLSFSLASDIATKAVVVGLVNVRFTKTEALSYP